MEAPPYEWDTANVDHIALHDVLPAEAEQVLENEPLELQKQERNGKQRIVHLGHTDVGRVLIVAITLRDGKIRVVTAYPANRKMRAFYSGRKAGSDDPDTLKTPDFETDQQAAEWFDNHQDELLAQFTQAAKDGTLTRGTLARRGLTSKTSIRLDDADIEMAKVQAEKRGLRYQTYLKMIIHQALVAETE